MTPKFRVAILSHPPRQDHGFARCREPEPPSSERIWQLYYHGRITK